MNVYRVSYHITDRDGQSTKTMVRMREASSVRVAIGRALQDWRKPEIKLAAGQTLSVSAVLAAKDTTMAQLTLRTLEQVQKRQELQQRTGLKSPDGDATTMTDGSALISLENDQ